MTSGAVLDLVIPCYNPPDNWHTHLINRFAQLKGFPGLCWHLILVDDGSRPKLDPEALAAIEKTFPGTRIFHLNQNTGKGAALRHGIREAEHPHTVFTDVDFPYSIESMVKLARQLVDDACDVCLGHREPDYYRNVPVFRRWLSRTMRWMLQHLLSLDITDTQCGLKGFNSKGRQTFLSTKTDGFLVDLEFAKRVSTLRNLRTAQVPVDLESRHRFSKMSFSLLFRELLVFMRIAMTRYESSG